MHVAITKNVVHISWSPATVNSLKNGNMATTP